MEDRNLFGRGKKALSLVFIAFILLVIIGLYFRLEPIGFVTTNVEFNYTDSVELLVNDSYEYNWAMEKYGDLKSVRLDGSLSKDGIAEVYLEYNNESYVVFDSSRLGEEGMGIVTGLVAGGNANQSSLEDVDKSEPINNKTNENKLITNNSLNNKSIIITIQGGGSRAIDDVFEFNVSSSFNWGVRYEKVCTRWEINDVNVCYGSFDCCALIGLESLGDWNSSFYLSYGRYGSGFKNIVKAQAIYANYSLDIEEPYADIVYSDASLLEADFYEERIEFRDLCIDSCLLPSLNASSYVLRIVVEEGNLEIREIRYSVEKEVNISLNAPGLSKEIENITIYKNEELVINLSGHFADEDGGLLSYSVYEVDNITVAVNGSIAALIPDYGFTGKRYMWFRASDGYYEAVSNVFSVNVVEKPLMADEVNISEELVKPSVVINRDVRWVKRVNASDNVINLSVNISSDALNVSVREVKEGRDISEDKIKVNDKGVVKNASRFRIEKRFEKIKNMEDELNRKKEEIIGDEPTNKEAISQINEQLTDLNNERNTLTGYVVVAREKGLLTRFTEWLFSIEIEESLLTGYAVGEVGNESSDVTSVIIEDIIKEIEVEYWTEGPYSKEENISRGKRIVISSDIHYTDVLAYTYLDDVSRRSVKLYHVVGEGRERVKDVSYLDGNNNGLIDYIEWVVPSLSNETYEVIIEIIKAEHLDVNRSSIADIYGYVKALDGNWSPFINSDEYVRVTFERPLDNTRDITIYARSNEGASIEVYIENGNETIARFENISNENWYRVYLTNLNSSYDVFDLKILNSSVEFDYIVDPTVTITGNETVTYSLLKNITAETGGENFTHLNISPNAPYGENLTFYMSFEGDKENTEGFKAFDFSKNNNNGTGNGNAKANSTNCRYGDCLQLDGNGDYVQAGYLSGINASKDMSISFWVRTTDSSNQAILGYDDDDVLAPTTEGVFYIYIPGSMNYGGIGINSEINGNVAVNDGSWHHVVITKNASNVSLYKDGSMAESTAVSNNAYQYPSGATFRLGFSFNVAWLSGQIDEIMILNTTLSAAQVSDIYNNQSARFVTEGTQKVKAKRLSENYGRVNLEVNYENNLDSNISARIGQINGSIDNLTGLVLYMPFEWGNAVDISGEDNDGTFAGNAFVNESGLNDTYGLQLDGNGDYVDAGNAGSLINELNTITVSAWVNGDVFLKNDGYNFSMVVSRENRADSFNYGLRIDSGIPKFWIHEVSGYKNAPATSAISTGQWYHLAGTWDRNGGSNNLKIYINGILNGTNTVNNDLTASYGLYVVIGRVVHSTINQYFNGTIDEVMIFNRSLSASEIRSIYLNQSSKHDVPYYTNYTNLTSSRTAFDINKEADFVFPDFKFYAGDSSNPFYTPLLIGEINITEGLAPRISFIDPTPANGSSQTETYVEVNVSIFEAESELDEVKFNWNGTNYTFYNDSLVLMMNFDNRSSLGESNTKVVDLSKYGNNGTHNGNSFINLSGGRYEGGVQLDGTGDWVSVADSSYWFFGNNNFTIFFWTKWSGTPGNTGLIGQSNGAGNNLKWAIYWNAITANSLTWHMHNPAGTQKDINWVWTPTTNKWYHIAITRNGSSWYLYINTTLTGGIQTESTAVPDVSSDLRIGADGENWGLLNGLIDELRIYTKSLSAQEVYELYVSNLYKYNQTQWYLYVNQSKNSTNGLNIGPYTYSASAKDTAGNENSTETRSIYVGIDYPSANKFAITGNTGTNIASIDNQGNMYLKGATFQSQSSLSPTPDSFIVQNGSMDPIAYINSTGYLFLKGTITENSDLTGMTNTNLEFRNGSDNIIAFFDNQGNLKLKGSLGDNYPNP